ncbi:XdhC family protein [Paenibacillus glycanilyticus]|uniref:Xanthine dehydrogenase n=1 Tax=Paenibacillus glycanilyticus TaxID=126569 RepID=A0ABQ6GKI5_9BACL|nr:XdhC family protein [Paenibacillus glycanilyticus]GLX70745.1 xanthine dehydrogenase [Paenibacillus glycanilyticus]
MDMISILRAIRQLEQPAVLATVIEVEGHAYRKAGAAMLLLSNGESIGTVSPGCIESDLFERISSVCETGRYVVVEYNMDPDEDPIWGEAVGCGGVIKVLLEPVSGAFRELLLEALHVLDTGRDVRIVRSLQGEELHYEIVAQEGEKSSELATDWEFDLLLSNRQRVILFGAGPDAVPIYQLLAQSSFHVIVADWRPNLLGSFPGAECYIGTPERLRNQLQLNHDDAVLVCSHQLYYDREMIQWALTAGPRYIGVMGSSKRIDLLFDGQVPPPAVKAPVGLSIGAEGPYEIAVSIAAELIGLRKQWRSLVREDHDPKGEQHERVRHLFGGGAEQPHGQTEVAARAFTGRSARQYGSSCSIG